MNGWAIAAWVGMVLVFIGLFRITYGLGERAGQRNPDAETRKAIALPVSVKHYDDGYTSGVRDGTRAAAQATRATILAELDELPNRRPLRCGQSQCHVWLSDVRRIVTGGGT